MRRKTVAKKQEEYRPKKIKWRKMGGGSFRLKSGKIIKPNQVFTAIVDDIPEAFRDVVVAMEDLPDEPPVIIDPIKDQYRIESDSTGKFNIIDVHGKVINENPLSPNEAQEMYNSLIRD